MGYSVGYAAVLTHAFVAMVLASGAALAGELRPAPAFDVVSTRTCEALGARVDGFPEANPVLLRSFENPNGSEARVDPALATVAFAYDNSLAVIALIACNRLSLAERIGNALLLASSDVRLRNGYLAGIQTDAPTPNGWWSETEGQWNQDPYQTGISTGNSAWIALAFLTLAESTGERRWIIGAEKIASRIVDEFTDGSGTGGFIGGISGLDGQTSRLTWKSTEHNVDLVAMFSWLARATGSRKWATQEARARHFVESQFDLPSGRFLIGTLPDGRTPNRAVSGLDTQLWPLLLPGADRRWRSALTFAESAHRVPGGFDYNDDRDGLWVEGTAQAALVYRLLGRTKDFENCMEEIIVHLSESGFLFATREQRITTGLAVNPESSTADFYYFRVPHLGATAWAAIAASGWNPFLGKAAGKPNGKCMPGKVDDAKSGGSCASGLP